MRRIAFAAMLLVSAWSFWAWAQPHGMPIRHDPPQAQGQTAQPPPLRQPLPAYVRPSPGEVKSAEANAQHQEEKELEHEGPPPINWTEFGTPTPPYVAMVINFAILVGGYYLLGRKPIAAGLQSRRDSIAKQIEEAARMRREAEERAKLYQSKLEKLEEEMRTAREGLVRAGEAERDRIVQEAEAKAERMRRDASFLVEQEMKQIREDLLRDTVEAAVGAAEELLKKRVTSSDQERLAEDYLADLGGKKTIPPPPAATGHGTDGHGHGHGAGHGTGTGTQESLS
jgi:F-type H+-transporting ATPase subunit b